MKNDLQPSAFIERLEVVFGLFPVTYLASPAWGILVCSEISRLIVHRSSTDNPWISALPVMRAKVFNSSVEHLR